MNTDYPVCGNYIFDLEDEEDWELYVLDDFGNLVKLPFGEDVWDSNNAFFIDGLY